MGDETAREFQFEVYHRRFKRPLLTSHGVWDTRSGIIVTLTAQSGLMSQGEIAPLPWFGTETLTQALNFCQQLGTLIAREQINSIPESLPCCQFALESAWLNLSQHHQNSKIEPQDLNLCALLPSGGKALTAWQSIVRTQNITTFKWKIGVFPLVQEIKLLRQLDSLLPPKIKLRLDANGGLRIAQAQQLLSVTDTLSRIEFIEQPLASDEMDETFQLSQAYITPIALDESVASFRRLKLLHAQGWQGLYIIKPAIMGFPHRLVGFCQEHSLKVVFSSVFETEVARRAAINMAQELNHPRALGFGTNLFW